MESEPAEKIKKMFFVYKENIVLYKAKKYVECAVSCEKITVELDSLQLWLIKDIGVQDMCRQIRRKLLDQIGKLHKSCIVKLNS
jgi:hypothetical protein